ncbi:MAG: phosphatase PAP2 family protein [Zoogloeaceae bacterium]|nr:phosphatase PAP2 family protein [Zoogloeaceae bacterium]
MRRAQCRVGWCFTALLLLVLTLGVIGVSRMGSSDGTAGAASLFALRANLGVCTDCDAGLMRMTALCGAAGWLLLLWAMCRARWAAWRGVLLFAACWLIFPLFQAIHQGFPGLWRFDAELLAIDRLLWGGKSLPEYALALENFWFSEVVSLGYFCFYFAVLLPVFWAAWRRERREAQCFLLGLNLMYLLGFIGYLCIPASGPLLAFPGIFPWPPEGGVITRFLSALVAQGITGMDVFPSLHGGVTLYILGFFALGRRRCAYGVATALLTLIALPLLLATVYLRYHYGIDLIAGIALAGAVLAWIHPKRHYQQESA